MREIFRTAARWIETDRPFALATLVELRQAKTAPLGTTIAVDDTGRIAGNIGAGCYESEIVETALRTAADGTTRQLDINLDQEDELLGGTACGAVMRVVVWRPLRDFLPTAYAIAEGQRAVELRVETFTCVLEPKAPLLLVGATALAQALCALAKHADFRTTVVDPRPAFATRERLPDADAIVHEWPEEFLPRALDASTAIVVLSHDPKLDLPALRAALRSPAPYVGLLGSRRAQSARRRALLDSGLTETELQRLRGPVGLDLGGRSTAETAVSIVAEIIAARSGRTAVPLRALAGTIH